MANPIYIGSELTEEATRWRPIHIPGLTDAPARFDPSRGLHSYEFMESYYHWELHMIANVSHNEHVYRRPKRPVCTGDF